MLAEKGVPSAVVWTVHRWCLDCTGLQHTFAAAGPRWRNSLPVQLCNPDITYGLGVVWIAQLNRKRVPQVRSSGCKNSVTVTAECLRHHAMDHCMVTMVDVSTVSCVCDYSTAMCHWSCPRTLCYHGSLCVGDGWSLVSLYCVMCVCVTTALLCVIGHVQGPRVTLDRSAQTVAH